MPLSRKQLSKAPQGDPSSAWGDGSFPPSPGRCTTGCSANRCQLWKGHQTPQSAGTNLGSGTPTAGGQQQRPEPTCPSASTLQTLRPGAPTRPEKADWSTRKNSKQAQGSERRHKAAVKNTPPGPESQESCKCPQMITSMASNPNPTSPPPAFWPHLQFQIHML